MPAPMVAVTQVVNVGAHDDIVKKYSVLTYFKRGMFIEALRNSKKVWVRPQRTPMTCARVLRFDCGCHVLNLASKDIDKAITAELGGASSSLKTL